MEFWKYYQMFRRWRLLAAAGVLVAVASAVVINQPGAADYRATATLSVPAEQRAIFVFGAPDQGAPDARLALILDLLHSRDFAARVIEQLGQALSPEELQRRLRVDRDRSTGFIRATVTAATPADAIVLANAVAQTAVAYDREVQGREGSLTSGFIAKQVGQARDNLDKAEAALLQFRQRNDFVLASAANQRVAALTAEQQRVDVALQENGSRLSSIRTQMDRRRAAAPGDEAADSPIAQQLRAQLAALEVALASELAIHTPNHPDVAALNAKIEAVKIRLTAERAQHNPAYDALAGEYVKLDTDRLALQAERDALQARLAGIQRQLPGLAGIQMEESRLAGDVAVQQKQYNDLQASLAAARLKEQQMEALGSLRIVDLARDAKSAPLGAKLLRLLLAAAVGLAGAGILAYFVEYLDNGLSTPEGAEHQLGLPALAAVPNRNRSFGESYRLMSMNIPASPPGEGQILAMTGPRPGAGTSTVVANFARAQAQEGRRTVVVDAAFQRPTQHALFGVANAKGLTQVLLGEAAPADVLAGTHIPNLSIVPSGAGYGRISGRLGSPAMAKVLEDLKARADVVLIDTPPIGAFADSLAVAPLSSGVVLVLDARRAPRGTEERAKTLLQRAGARIVGFVLNKVRPDLVDSYVFQQRYYGGRRTLVPAAAAASALIIALAAAVYFSINPWNTTVAAAQHSVVLPHYDVAAGIRSAMQWVHGRVAWAVALTSGLLRHGWALPRYDRTSVEHAAADIGDMIAYFDVADVGRALTRWASSLSHVVPHDGIAGAARALAGWLSVGSAF